METIIFVFKGTWEIFLDSAPYIIFGIIIAGLIRVFLRPETIYKNLGTGKISSVVKAALLGIPLPLCSCGVLPAAAGLKKQGATKGATTAFLISTPESGVDSIAITYALLDPIMTVARPLAAFITAFFAGVLENVLFFKPNDQTKIQKVDLSCPIDSCCDGVDCPPGEHASHHSFIEKTTAGLKFAFSELWGELAPWFAVGIFLAGIITVLIPDNYISNYLGGGISSMLLVLLFAVPLYICATASTPIAAALILKGVSPGVALVFLLTGPATNIASLTVLLGVLGKRGTLIYLFSIVIFAVLSGLLLDQVYFSLGISVQATIGEASEIVPAQLKYVSGIILLVLSLKPLNNSLLALIRKLRGKHSDGTCGCDHDHDH